MDHVERPDVPAQDPDLLTGWKEIASYLGKSVRTVQRWEQQNSLPVHRVQPLGEVVFARRSELDRWRETPPLTGSHAAGAPTIPDEGSETGTDLVPEPPARIGDEADVPSETSRRLRAGRWAVQGVAGVLIALALAMGVQRVGGRAELGLLADPPEPRMQGQTFMMTVDGFDPASPATRWIRLPNGREESLSSALRPDDRGGMRWGFTTDCNTETGTHYLWMRDSEGRQSEPVRVVVLANPACERPMPDLAARVLGIDTASVPAGGRITVRFTIWNMGNADAVATQTRIRVSVHSSRTAVTDTPLGDVAVEPLPVGASAVKEATVTVPPDLAPGVYYLWVIADNGNATIEPNSFNNFARSHAFVVTGG